MAKNNTSFASLQRTLRKMEREIDQIVRVTISQYANRMFTEAMANLGHPELVGKFNLVFEDGGYKVSVTTDSNIAAYIEFGTGNYARDYLSGQPQEVSDEAIKFYISGDGTMPARPYLFPAYFKYREMVVPEINKRVEALMRRYNML